MKDPIQPHRCAGLLAALAAPDRLRIVRVLLDGPRTVTQIAEAIHVTTGMASHHLAVLHRARLLQKKKRGRFVEYFLPPAVFRPGADAAAAYLDLGCCRLELPREDG